MTSLRFRARIDINGVNPFVPVDADQGVGPGDTIDFVGHSGGVQRMAAASRILATMMSMVIGWPGSPVRSRGRITT